MYISKMCMPNYVFGKFLYKVDSLGKMQYIYRKNIHGNDAHKISVGENCLWKQT